MSRRLRHPGVWLLGGVAAAALLAALALTYVTRSDWGRGEILAFTLRTLGGRLNGTLVVDRLEGNVFTGARLYDVAILEADDDPLLTADSAYIEYDLPTFLGGDIVINQLVVYSARLELQRLPGDSLWNYQELLLDTTRTEGAGPGRATLLEELVVIGGDVRVRLPWEPDPELGPAAREEEIRLALDDTSRLMVEEVPGGYLRTILADLDTLALQRLLIAPDERGGTSLAVRAADGEVLLYDGPPLVLRGLRGELGLREGVLRYRAPRVALRGSVLESAGVVDLTGEEPLYDVVVAGRDVELSDLQWLYPPIPDRGSLTASLWVETRPDGLLILTRDFLAIAPDTRVYGDFGVLLGDTIRFVDVELAADPLDVSTVRQLLPPDLPVDGLRIGAVIIDNPAS